MAENHFSALQAISIAGAARLVKPEMKAIKKDLPSDAFKTGGYSTHLSYQISGDIRPLFEGEVADNCLDYGVRLGAIVFFNEPNFLHRISAIHLRKRCYKI